MTNPLPAVQQDSTGAATSSEGPGPRKIGLAVFGTLSVAWIAFLLLGKVNARFWLSGEHQIAWKSIRGIWAIQLDELPGGAAIQWLVAGSMAVFVVGVIAGLYLLLVASDGTTDGDGPALQDSASSATGAGVVSS